MSEPSPGAPVPEAATPEAATPEAMAPERALAGAALRVLTLLIVVFAIAGVTIAAGSPGAVKARTFKAVARPVQGVTLVCPSVAAQNNDVVTETEVATSRPGAGTALVQTVSAAGMPALAGAPPQQVVSLSAAVTPVTLPPGPPLVITATGAASGGVVATRVTRGDGPTSRERGYAIDDCTQPRTDAWFVGTSTAAGNDGNLELTNADDSPAEVSVRALTKEGLVTPTATTGQVIAPHVTERIPVDAIAPNEDTTAIEVVTVRGRIASSIREHRGLNSTKPGGVEAIPQAAGATRTVTVPGVIGDVTGTIIDGSRLHRVLTIGNPGVADATVTATVTDENGTFVPSGFDQIDVPGGTVREVVLDTAITAERATLRITSAEHVPLVAGVLVDAQARFGDFHDILHVGAGTPLTGPTIFPDARVEYDANGKTDTFLVVSALDGNAAVTITAGTMPYGILIPNGSINEVKAHVGSKRDTAIIVSPNPGSKPVYAAVTIEELGLNGPLIAGGPISGGLADVTLPPAASKPDLPLVDAATNN